VSEGRFKQYTENFEGSEATERLLKVDGEENFTAILKDIGVGDEGDQKALYQEFSTLKTNLSLVDTSDTLEGAGVKPVGLMSSCKPSGKFKGVRKPLRRDNTGPTGLNIQDKLESIQNRNKNAIENLKVMHESKMKEQNLRLKERLQRKKNKKLGLMVDQGMPEADAKAAVEKEIEAATTAIDAAQSVIETEHAENFEVADASPEAVMAQTYEPLLSWLTDWLVSLGADLNDEDSTGLNALMYACQSGIPSLVQIFIERGSDPNSEASDGSSAIHVAAQWGHAEVMGTLLNLGADPNAVNADGWTPLLFASIGGHLECVKMLIAVGAKMDTPDDDGFTALAYATEGQHKEVAQCLRDAGANLLG